MSRILPFKLNIQSGFANSAHTIASYAALALLGIHVGLNWNWICTKVSAHIPLSAGIKKALAYIALALVLVLGGISATQINFASLAKGGHGGGAFSLKNLAVVILNFGSLSALFGIAAYYLLKISRKARKA